MFYRLLPVLTLLALGLAPAAPAAEPAKPAKPATKEDPAVTQEILSRQFRDFEQSLLRLAQRLERSGKPEDKQRAANLKKAIELASSEQTERKFEKLIDILKTNKDLSPLEIKEAMDQNRMLADDIRAILALLLADTRDDEIKRERKRIEQLIKELDKIIR